MSDGDGAYQTATAKGVYGQSDSERLFAACERYGRRVGLTNTVFTTVIGLLAFSAAALVHLLLESFEVADSQVIVRLPPRLVAGVVCAVPALLIWFIPSRLSKLFVRTRHGAWLRDLAKRYDVPEEKLRNVIEPADTP